MPRLRNDHQVHFAWCDSRLVGFREVVERAVHDSYLARPVLPLRVYPLQTFFPSPAHARGRLHPDQRINFPCWILGRRRSDK